MRVNVLVEGRVVSCASTWQECLAEAAYYVGGVVARHSHCQMPLRAYYVDAEGESDLGEDLVPVVDQASFQQAVRWAHEEGLQALDLHFCKKDEEEKEEEAVASPPPPPLPTKHDAPAPTAVLVMHEGISCNGKCAKNNNHKTTPPISGPRFQSLVVPSVNLCSACEQTGEFDDQFGPFCKINRPENRAPLFLVSDLTQTPLAKQFTAFMRGGGGGVA